MSLVKPPIPTVDGESFSNLASGLAEEIATFGDLGGDLEIWVDALEFIVRFVVSLGVK